MYLSIIYPHLLYGNILWSAASQSHLNKLFTKQKKAIRLIMKKQRHTHTNPLFYKLKLLKLNDICKLNTLIFIFKSLNNLVYSTLHFQIRIVAGYQLRNNGNQLQVPFSRYNYVKAFIRIRGPNLWNTIPLAIRESRTLMTFKRKIKFLYIDSYSEWAKSKSTLDISFVNKLYSFYIELFIDLFVSFYRLVIIIDLINF